MPITLEVLCRKLCTLFIAATDCICNKYQMCKIIRLSSLISESDKRVLKSDTPVISEVVGRKLYTLFMAKNDCKFNINQLCTIFLSFFNFRVRLKGVEERHARYFGGAWQKVVFVVLSDKSLQKAENVFECEVSLPHTEFVTKRTTIYSPSKAWSFISGQQQL